MSPTAMPEKQRVRYQQGATALLEPGETVQLAVGSIPIPAIPYLVLVLTVISPLVMLPYTIQKNASVLLTDRNVYVMKNGFNSFKPKLVLFKAPLGGYEVEVGGATMLGPYLRVGEHRIWLALAGSIRRRAEAIAAAGAPSAVSTAD